MKRKSGLLIISLMLFTFLAVTAGIPSGQAADHPLKGKKIEMAIHGLGGWLPSRLGVDMSPLFAEYAKKNYGYDVKFTLMEAPFSSLFQKAASELATRTAEYNFLVVDSQWLGGFAEPGWIVNVNDLIKKYPELNIEWYDRVVKETYQVYPDGTDQLWGFPEEADAEVLYVRKDLFQDPKEKAAFKAKYGMELPQTFEDWEKVSMDDFEKMCEFFTRPDKGLYGIAMQYSKEYDFISMQVYPFMFSLGGDIWEPKTRKVYGILNSDVNAKGMEWNKRMLKYNPPGSTTNGIAEAIDLFAHDKVATALQWAAVGPAMVTKDNKDRIMVVPPPCFKQKDGSCKRLYSIGGQPWVIIANNDKEHMMVAIDFIRWWYLPETQLEFAKRGGQPAVKAVLEAKGFEDIQPWFRAFKYMLRADRSRDFWHDPKYSEMLAVQQEGFSAYATGQVNDARKVLEYIACEQQKILYEAGRSKIKPPDSCKNVQLK